MTQLITGDTADLDIDFADPAFLANPWPALMALQQDNPVFWSERNRGWIITRHADVKAAYADKRLSSARGLEQILRDIPQEDRDKVSAVSKYIPLTVNRLDGRDHMRVRTLMMKAFTPAIVRSLGPLIQSIVDRLLDDVGDGGEIDFGERISAMLPPLVIQHLLGIPESERNTLFGLVSDFTATTAAARVTPALVYKLDETLKTMNAIFSDLIADREKNPGNDLISLLVQARDGKARLSQDELLASFHAIIVAGAESTAHTLTTQIVQLCRRPDLQDLVRGDPEAAYPVVTELLRYPGTVKAMTRLAAESFTWHDQQIEKGDLLWIMNFGANVDERVFDAPLEIRADRDNRESMAFGPGLHHCIGHMLSRLELATFFASAFDRYDISVPEQDMQYHPSFVFYALKSLKTNFRKR
ncbi:putative cytochrome P450 [Caenibius tardaugens NBRC 16725]|uniref:Putative cytochrome P450 n=1 Tax=Caenibius tardaugens NBRC 16725 TaxID=1219035 RepID=U2YAI0_9SPHN|nr:cytochrome P450 [Caenibius tardaugens]AZI35496.1 cytochrome P450 [Caenibius tardaugens NBRC 16725]GAD50406.1 putative cytochrome P450 [Caenibius tardaugens NBRC 16725]